MLNEFGEIWIGLDGLVVGPSLLNEI